MNAQLISIELICNTEDSPFSTMGRLITLGLFAIVVAIISTSRAAVAAPPCSVVNTKVVGCLSYIEGATDHPTDVCCNGVKDISALAKSKADVVGVCNCIKADLAVIKNYIPARIAGLPKSCGVNLIFPPIDSNYNCSK